MQRPSARLTASSLAFSCFLAGALAAPLSAAERPDPTEATLVYLRTHPGDYSLVVYDVLPDSSIDPTGLNLSVRPDERLPLASTMKIVILSAYAREVAAGRIDPEETMTVGDWERLYIPLAGGASHRLSLGALGQGGDLLGYSRHPERRVTLDQLADFMIRFSDNTATDAIRRRVGDPALRETIAELGLRDQDLPLSIVGCFLSWSNFQIGSLSEARLRHLRRLPRTAYEAEVRHWEDSLLDPGFRRAERRFFRHRFTFPLLERASELTFPRGSVRDYAHMLAGVATGIVLTPAAVAIVRRHLESSHTQADRFEFVGWKAGSLPGVITHAAYGMPSSGELRETLRVGALFIHRMPKRDFDPSLDLRAPLLFNFRLLRDADFARRVIDQLGPQ